MGARLILAWGMVAAPCARPGYILTSDGKPVRARSTALENMELRKRLLLHLSPCIVACASCRSSPHTLPLRVERLATAQRVREGTG
eukprot:gene7881-biopygen16590